MKRLERALCLTPTKVETVKNTYVMHLLYERVLLALLVESKVDTVARKFTRKALGAIKNGMDKINNKGRISLAMKGLWPQAVKRKDFFGTQAGQAFRAGVLKQPVGQPMMMTVTVEVRMLKGTPERVSIGGSWSPGHDTLTIDFVVMSPDGTLKPQHLSTIQSKMYDAIRHELEHSTQKDEDLVGAAEAGKVLKSMTNGWWKNTKAIVDYYTSTAEIGAFVAGFYHRAKKERRPFIDVADEYLNEFIAAAIAQGADPVELRNVHAMIRYKWIEYAKKRFQKAIVEK